MASYWFRSGVKEKVNRPYECGEELVCRKQLDWCLDTSGLTHAGRVESFSALTLLLVPFIGGEFMPHLDEGALWVRATMPYTISFEEASKIAPQIRDILMSYPQVTVVGSELGRPDDGTDSTGFFNCEFYVGLKPYNDKSWEQGSIHNKEELTAAINKRLITFPGIIFNYTQPAEDAVDEALDWLEELARGQSIWSRLERAGEEGDPGQEHSGACAWLYGADRGARAWPAHAAD